MNNIQCIRQTGQQYDIRHPFNSNIFCRSDESTISSGLCLSDKFDEHGTNIHIQRQNSFSIIGTSTGQFIRKLLEIKFNNNLNNNNHHHQYYINSTDWLMIFIASKARLFCRRPKLFDPNRYPSLEQWIIVLNCHCSNLIDFYFDDPQANQFMCDYLDALSLKGRFKYIINNKIFLFSFFFKQHLLKIVIHGCLLDIYPHVNMFYVYQHRYV
jgi:hypothetical protein